jgi:hypothetical protein
MLALDGGRVGPIDQLERDHHSDQDFRGLSDQCHRKGSGDYREDNMTEKKAVNACFFPQEPHLCADLWRTVGSAVWGEVRAFYIESEKQPADEYTRGLRPSRGKILAAVARMLSMDIIGGPEGGEARVSSK